MKLNNEVKSSESRKLAKDSKKYWGKGQLIGVIITKSIRVGAKKVD